MSEDFELTVRFRREKDTYQVLGFSMDNDGHIPYGAKAMFKALFRKVMGYVLPGTKLVEKFTFGLSDVPRQEHFRLEWPKCYLPGPPVKGQPPQWRVNGGHPPRPHYLNPDDARFHAHQLLVLADRWEAQMEQDRATALFELSQDPEQMDIVIDRLLRGSEVQS